MMAAGGDYLYPKEAAPVLGVDYFTLKLWRQMDIGPRYIKIGHFIRYRRKDLEDWLLALGCPADNLHGKRLNERQAADFLGVCAMTMVRWRKAHKGPPWFKLGGRFYYSLEDLEDFLKLHVNDWTYDRRFIFARRLLKQVRS